MFLDEDQHIIQDYAEDHDQTPVEAEQQLHQFDPDVEDRRLQKLLNVMDEHGSGKIPEDYHYRFQEAGYDISLFDTRKALIHLVQEGVIGRYYLDTKHSQADQPYYTYSVWEAVQKQDVEPFDTKPMTHVDINYQRLKRIAERTGIHLDAVVKETLQERQYHAKIFGGLTESD